MSESSPGRSILLAVLMLLVASPPVLRGQAPLVFQSDFGTADGAVAAMRGVAAGVDADLPIHDLTHEIPPFDVWRAAYRLNQAAPYWPAGTVFVSVVDPGVGTDRKSVVLETRSGHYFVTPDNGTLTLVADELGIEGVREIDESRNRRRGSYDSHTFHGRDVYAYTGARLAAGVIDFRQVGPALAPEVVRIEYQEPRVGESVLRGAIPVLDVRFGNVWTNVPADLLSRIDVSVGEPVEVTIRNGGEVSYRGVIPFARTFGEVPVGEPLLYVNSLGNVAVGLNQASFAASHGVRAGADWSVEIRSGRP